MIFNRSDRRLDGADGLPKNITEFDDVREASERRKALRGQREQVQSRVNRLEVLVEASDAASLDKQRLAVAAEALFAGEAAPAFEDPRQALAAGREEIEVIRQAERLAIAKVSSLIEFRSKQICRAFAPSHRKAVRRIARALIELIAAGDEERTIRTEVARRGARVIEAELPEMSFPYAVHGSAQNGGSAAGVWLNTALALGFVADGEVLVGLGAEDQ